MPTSLFYCNFVEVFIFSYLLACLLTCLRARAYVHTCECMCVYGHIYVHIHVHIYVNTCVEGREQARVSLLRCHLPFLVETGSLTWPGTHLVCEVYWPLCSYLPPQYRGCKHATSCQAFLDDVHCEVQTQDLMRVWLAFYLQTYLPSPCCCC